MKDLSPETKVLKSKTRRFLQLARLLLFGIIFGVQSLVARQNSGSFVRERISIDDDWRFFRYDSISKADDLMYDVRPEVTDRNDNKVDDSKPTKAVKIESSQQVLKPWILPSGNNFIEDPGKQHIRPEGNPGGDFPFVRADFDDTSWEQVNLPHDWAIKEPFEKGLNAEVGGGMGRLPGNGVAWYRKKLDIPASDAGKSIFLDIDGAMSYAMVWLNGKLVGGWPYGRNSWRLNLTPFAEPGGMNQLAIRLDNPNNSSRWYPGGGIYRNVWLVKTNPGHVAQSGTFIQTKNVSKTSATINLEVTIDNDSQTEVTVEVSTEIYAWNSDLRKSGKAVARFSTQNAKIPSGKNAKLESSAVIENPKLWGPPPAQQPNLYLAETTVLQNGKPMDIFQTRFGVRSLDFDPDKGLLVNGEHVLIKGVNQHHDLGALGAAFNTRAAERQLEVLREMGCNAIRMAHNPPAPELLELTDKMGFLVIDEIFDSWELKKTPLDFHLIFPDWYEPDTRAFVRRDRNCPSVMIWSFGNEVGEQYTGEAGAAVAQKLHDMVREEDPTRPTTTAMNYAKPDMPLPKIVEVIGLNYQGEGIRDAAAYANLQGIKTSPQYPAFHEKFPDKMIVSTETASALSTRGTYLFPVVRDISAPVQDGLGGNPKTQNVSSYELYTAPFGASADKVFASQDKHPYVAGEFVWTGWDYLGEPTPYYLARSSYSGMIDLAGFKKDRFYLYQSRWRPELPMAHILPHWNWPGRVGKITPVHVFTSGDEGELFLNGKSLGIRKKEKYEYRLRWDSVKYEPGELKVVAYKNGKKWAEDAVKTTGEPARLETEVDRSRISADGKDLAFVTVKVTDKEGLVVPVADNQIQFSLDGPAEILATDNGNPSDMVAFRSKERKAFNGLALVIVRSKNAERGTITLTAKSPGLKDANVEIRSE
jgi:beta-galactosidase